jgi:hypothetical protein
MNIIEPYMITLDEKINNKPGKLVCINNSDIDLNIKRVFYIYGFDNNIEQNNRGYHGHKNTTQILCILNGSVNIITKNIINNNEQEILLDLPNKLLVIPPNNFIKMEQFSENAILLVLCDTEFKDDIYIY